MVTCLKNDRRHVWDMTVDMSLTHNVCMSQHPRKTCLRHLRVRILSLNLPLWSVPRERLIWTLRTRQIKPISISFIWWSWVSWECQGAEELSEWAGNVRGLRNYLCEVGPWGSWGIICVSWEREGTKKSSEWAEKREGTEKLSEWAGTLREQKNHLSELRT